VIRIFGICLIGICFFGGCSTSGTGGPANHPLEDLVVLGTVDMGATDMDVRFEEISRQGNISRVRVTIKEGKSVPTSMFITRGFYEIARARDMRYAVHKIDFKVETGTYEYVAGFTDDADTKLKKQFGKEFSGLNDNGDPFELIDLRMFDALGWK